MSLVNKSPSNLTLTGKLPVEEEIRHIECGDLIFVYGSPRSGTLLYKYSLLNRLRIL